VDEELARGKGAELMNRSKIAFLGSIDADGCPVIKAMFNAKNNGLKEVWFSTNTSSKRTSLFSKNNRASVYFVDEVTFEGLLLAGTIELLQ
jgi:general stress protein 26